MKDEISQNNGSSPDETDKHNTAKVLVLPGLIYSAAAASNVMDTHYTTHVQHDWLQGARTGSTVRAHAALH